MIKQTTLAVRLTAGDSATRTDHVFLLDISDAADTQGVSGNLLSHGGAGDVEIAGVLVKTQP